jgi:hypothetical protein
MPRTRFRVVLAVLASVAFAELAYARVKLISLPARDRVEIRLENQNATMIEEERTVPLVKGLNQVDFSWANTRIDPDTIVFRIIDSTGEVNVLSVSYPPKESALIWNVAAENAGPARVRISYLIGQLSKSSNYRAIAARDEKTLRLAHFVKLRNDAPETFGESGIWLGADKRIERPIAGDQTRELLVERWNAVPIVKTFTADVQKHGWQNQAQNKVKVAMHYVLSNERAAGLGATTLPYGKVRIFQQDSRGGNAFLGEDWGKRTAPGAKMQLFLGQSRDIAVKRTIERNTRERIEGNLYNQHVVLRYEIENFKDVAAELRIHEAVGRIRSEFLGKPAHQDTQWEVGDETTFPGRVDAQETDIKRVAVRAKLPPAQDAKAQKQTYLLHLIFRNEW